MSPTLKKGIGMGYVISEKCLIGSPLWIKIRKNIIPAVIVKTPFVNL
jgi:aminomethyltransferase